MTAQLTDHPPAEPDPVPPGRPDPEPADLAASAHSRTGWRAVTTRGRLTVVVAAVAAVLGAVTGWREWTGIAAALAVLLVAAVLMALGRSSAAVELELPRSRFVVGERGAATVQVRNVSTRRMLATADGTGGGRRTAHRSGAGAAWRRGACGHHRAAHRPAGRDRDRTAAGRPRRRLRVDPSGRAVAGQPGGVRSSPDGAADQFAARIRAGPGRRGVDQAHGQRPVVPHPAGIRAG